MINLSQDDIVGEWVGPVDQPLVSIGCLAYNHEPFIAQAIESFLMQKTSFPFEVLIHNDASIDRTAEIIKEYEKKYPAIIKPIYQTENQYSKGVNVSDVNLKRAKGKYIAVCEGDDFWIDPLKLQKQVDWMESHPGCMMCCSDAKIICGDEILDWSRYKKDTDIPVRDMILGGGCFVSTCTFLVRKKEYLEEFPECCRKCHVGDYPLQLWSVLTGSVHYFAAKMGAYRYRSVGSWTSRNRDTEYEKKIKGWRSEIDMLDGLNAYSNNRYKSLFVAKQTSFIVTKMLYAKGHLRKREDAIAILYQFPDIQKKFSFSQKIDVFLMKHEAYFFIRLKRKIYIWKKKIFEYRYRTCS